MTWTLNGAFVDVTGTEASLSGSEVLAGVTLTSFGALNIYDFGTLQLRVDGNLTINGNDAANRECLLIGNGASDTTADINIRTGGVLTVGSRAAQDGNEFSTDQYWPSIYEKDNLNFGNSSCKATTGESILGSSTARGFFVVDGGATFNWYGCVNFTGGMGWDGLGNKDGTPNPTTNATIRVKDGVMDVRRVAARTGTDNFIYTYSGDCEIEGLKMICSDVIDSGIGFIIVEPPNIFRGVEPVFCEAPFGGSTTVPRDMVFTIENYPGNFGSATQQDGNFVCQQTIGNSEWVTFLDGAKGSQLVLSPAGGFTQTYAAAEVMARQTVRAKAFTPSGAAVADGVVATQDKNRLIYQASSVAQAAIGILTMPDQPINAAVMTIGSKVYTFQSTLTNVDGNIQIGASLAISKQNILDAINLTGTPGTQYAAAMTVNADISAATAWVGDDLTLTAKATGEAGNALDLFRGFYIPAGTGGSGSLNNVFDFNKMGTSLGGSAVGEYNLGRPLLVRYIKDGDGIVGSHMLPRFFNPGGFDADLWSFYLYSYPQVNRSRTDVLMRTVGGQDIEFIVPDDLSITQPLKATVDVYGDLRDMGRVYDYCKSFKVANVAVPVLEAPLCSASGSVLDFGEFDIRIDGDIGGPLTVSQAAATRDQVAQGLTWAESTVAAISAGDNRYLVAGVSHDNDPQRNIVSITYGGIPMTRLGKRAGPTTRLGTSVAGIEVWGLGEVGITAAADTNIVVVWDTAPTNFHVFRASFTAVSQIGSPLVSIDSDWSQDEAPTAETALATNVTAEDNGVVLCFAVNQSAGAITFEGGLTERLESLTNGHGFAVADVFPVADGLQSADVTSTENVVLSIALRPRQGLITIFPNQAAIVTRIGETEAISSGVSDEIVIAFPAGIEDGDVAYIAVGHAQSAANAWNTPAGWVIPTGLTEVATGGTPASVPGVSVFRRVLSGDSGSVTITNVGTNTSGIVAQMIVYRGCDAAPEDVTSTTATGASGDPDPASITPSTDDVMILTFGFMDDGDQTSPTPPATYTAILDTQTPDGAGTGE